MAAGEGAASAPVPSVHDKMKMDNEYLSLMEELGESTPKPVGADINVNNIKKVSSLLLLSQHFLLSKLFS